MGGGPKALLAPPNGNLGGGQWPSFLQAADPMSIIYSSILLPYCTFDPVEMAAVTLVMNALRFICSRSRAGGDTSSVLLYSTVSVVNYTACNSALQVYNYTLYSSMLCTSTTNYTGQCFYDGGVPVACASGRLRTSQASCRGSPSAARWPLRLVTRTWARSPTPSTRRSPSVWLLFLRRLAPVLFS